MKFFNKKAIELAASTLVTIIVAILVFTFALSITFDVFCGADEYAQNVDAQSEQELNRILSTGAEVQVAANTQQVERGGGLCRDNSGGYVTYSLGIKNSKSSPTNFIVTIYNESGAVVDDAQVFSPIEIDVGDSATTSILIPINQEVENLLIYTVEVTDSAGFYGAQQLYVKP